MPTAPLFLPYGVPIWGYNNPSSVTFSGVNLNANNVAVGWAFQPHDVLTITHLGFRYNQRTGTPPTYLISLQSLTTGGLPDGTPKGGGSPASKTFTPPADATWDGTWQWIALDNAYAATRGELLAIAIEYSSGTVNGSNFSNITARWFGGPQLQGFPHSFTMTAGTWSRGFLSPVFGYRTASGRFGQPLVSSTVTNVASDLTPDEVGLSFNVPAEIASAYQCLGVDIQMRGGPTATDFDLVLYSGTTVIQTLTIDCDVVSVSSELFNRLYFADATLPTLVGGQTYRLAIKPNFVNASGQAQLRTWTFAENADLGAFPGGTSWVATSRTDGGAWSDTDTARPFLIPLLHDISHSAPVVIYMPDVP